MFFLYICENLIFKSLSYIMKFRKFSILVCLLMSVSLCASASSEFFKEGRCYWYRYKFPWGGGPTDMEFCIRVAGKEIKDGKEWNRIDLIKRLTRLYEDWEYVGVDVDNSVIPIAYVREENGDIYHSYEGIESQWSEQLSSEWMCVLYSFSGPLSERSSAELCYGYGSIGKKVELGYWTKSHVYSTATVTAVEPYENSGHVYNKYTIDYTSSPGEAVDEFFVIESIGAFGPYDKGSDYTYPESRGDGQIIYDPLRPAMSARDFNAQLAYVTEGEDNVIIFEKDGGFKLWEFTEEGVEAVQSDENVLTRWFNLQGVEIPEPVNPGVYIRKTGHKVEKVRL